MRVSHLLKFMILAVLVSLCFILAPVTAGEHPWDEDQYGDTTGTSDIIEPEPEPEPIDSGDNDKLDLFGTPLFWWELFLSGIDEGDSQTVSGSEAESSPSGQPGLDTGGNNQL